MDPLKILNKARKIAKDVIKREGANVDPGHFVRMAQLPKNSRFARARMRGWNDVVNDKGYRDSYDDWPSRYKKTGKKMQLAYERGRAEAWMAKAASRVTTHATLSEWKKNELIEGPMFRAVGPQIGANIIETARRTVRSGK